MPHYTGKNGELRLYDSAATPFYYVVDFVQMDLTGPLGRGRPDENLNLDRGNLTTAAFYHQGPDDPILEPLDLSFSALIDEAVNRQDLLDALQCGTVGGDSWTTTKGDSSLTSGSGASVATPSFADSLKKCVDCEVIWTGTTVDIGYRWQEIYFPPESITLTESADVLVLAASGQCYGAIAEITAFTAGTESST